MNSQNPLFAVCVFSIAFLTAYGIQRGIKWEPRSQRYESIDGMRGFLAICVFIHHSNIWERFIHTGKWELGDSKFFNQLVSLLILKNKPQIVCIFTSITFVVFFYIVHGVLPQHIYSFIGGGIAPFPIEYTSLSKKIGEGVGSAIVVGCFLAVGQFRTSEDICCTLLISIAFTTIALGNSLFGILKNNTLKFLGEISYSTYLLHGIVLSNTFIFGFGLETLKHFSSVQYCSIVIAIVTPIVVIVSFLGFKYIEQPFMNRSKAIIQRLNAVNEL